MPPAQAMNILHPIGLVTFPAIASLRSVVATSASEIGGAPASPEGPMLALPGIAELWPVLAIMLLIFGGRKLPELARAMGSSVTQFKKGLESNEDDEAKSIENKSEPKSE